MITELHLHGIGPATDLELEFGERLNVVTGDNGLGKTFLLDACWYALTWTWADGQKFYALPNSPRSARPSIDYTVVGETGRKVRRHAGYHFPTQDWRLVPDTPPPIPSLVVYARIDGGFSVWDPARNYSPYRVDSQRREAHQFSKKEVWEGIEEGAGDQKRTISNGLLRDVETWRLKANRAFQQLQTVLDVLSCGEDEKLKIGEGVRVRFDDTKDIPTIEMPYGLVPVTQAAAGVRRVLALAYLLVWAWEEHLRASELKKQHPTNRIVLLFDEVEAHLHPKWQRVFLPSLLQVVSSLMRKGTAAALVDELAARPDQKAKALLENQSPESIQIIATTHAPLVLASVEVLWREDQDRLFGLNLDPNRQVHLDEIPFAKHGNIVNWLDSESFDSTPAYSVPAKKAIERADAFMRQHPDSATASPQAKEEVHAALKAALGGDDEYWPYWLPYYEHAKTNA